MHTNIFPTHHPLRRISLLPRRPSRNNHPSQNLPLLLQDHQPRILNQPPLRRRPGHRTLRNLRRNNNSRSRLFRATSPLPPLSDPRPPNNNPLIYLPMRRDRTPRADLRMRRDIRMSTYCGKRLDRSGGVDMSAWENGGLRADSDEVGETRWCVFGVGCGW